ncbi:GTP cyclohydrolase II [Coelomomyces lativittatus]|nr:GTP cyclohydrolase II [Coelomomyces lativittatus]KAJ1507659.1 GTP cyclohydrolase II [Coelomomyces lativittatus]KAJ1511925.1 GTP cyclohydrolase II [Coelomomyces lativittatus]
MSSTQSPNEPTPIATCLVRTRIPNTHFSNCYLHVYSESDSSTSLHFAYVFGFQLRSRTLDAHKELSEFQRIVHGASVPSMSTSTHPSSTSLIMDTKKEIPLVRVHSQCFTGETLGSLRCDCGSQFSEAIQLMAKEKFGVLVYLGQEGRGIGLVEKLRSYNLQDIGHTTVTANQALHHPNDLRSYALAAWILNDLNIHQVRLLTNNPEKVIQLQQYGIKVIERIGMIPPSWKAGSSNNNGDGKISPIIPPNSKIEEMDSYLLAKVKLMDHLIDLPPHLNTM